MSAIRALKNKILAKNEEFSKKSQESWKLLEKIAGLQAEHEGVCYEINRIRMEVEELNQKLDTLDYPRPVWVESKQEEPEAEILASVTPHALPLPSTGQ
jgi:predicted nuclease with TOPRIM domain